MKALSLTQPWATLMALNAKKVETRSWKTSYTGRVAIHAAKGFPADAKDFTAASGVRTILERHGVVYSHNTPKTWIYHAEYRYQSGLPLGAIVAIGSLQYCRLTEHLQVSEQERAFGNYDSGRYGWVFVDIQPMEHPIPCKGALGLWTVPEDIAIHVEIQRSRA